MPGGERLFRSALCLRALQIALTEKAAAAKKEAEARLNQPKETQKQEQKPAPSKEVPKQEQQKPAPIQAPASTQKPETVK